MPSASTAATGARAPVAGVLDARREHPATRRVQVCRSSCRRSPHHRPALTQTAEVERILRPGAVELDERARPPAAGEARAAQAPASRLLVLQLFAGAHGRIVYSSPGRWRCARPPTSSSVSGLRQHPAPRRSRVEESRHKAADLPATLVVIAGQGTRRAEPITPTGRDPHFSPAPPTSAGRVPAVPDRLRIPRLPTKHHHRRITERRCARSRYGPCGGGAPRSRHRRRAPAVAEPHRRVAYRRAATFVGLGS